jgi:hypothetical protein
MLQGIRASSLTMPSFGHDTPHAGVQKVDGYSDADAWMWPQSTTMQHTASYPTTFDPSVYSNFAPQVQPPAPRGPPRHHSIATPRALSTISTTTPPARAHVPPNVVKAQPAFKPTWQGFLDSTKDAMTIVEAALQGRLSHISRRPHDKERAEMLTSGTVLVYEENASGIKRWTDAVHWSPSRVMNNCLIYRQLVRALKPEEKKTALNPSGGTKRKRKESTGPIGLKNGDREDPTNADDEYENPSFDGALSGYAESAGKVYANFAQSLTPDQQRRFCGSLIDSYEFKEGGLMKKTISVKYQGTHHHIISYYSLEDVVSGKLKRPFQDPKLANIHPRPELLNGWKVNLEDEESKDVPLVAGYSQHIQPSHLQHHVVGPATQTAGGHNLAQAHAPLHLQVPEYWQSSQGSQYTAHHHSPQQYPSSQSAVPQYTTSHGPRHFPVQQPPQVYPSQQQQSQQYVQTSPSQHYPSPQSSSPQYPVQTAVPQSYHTETQPGRHYAIDRAQPASATQYSRSSVGSQYSPARQVSVSHSSQYAASQTPNFDLSVPVSRQSPPRHQPNPSALQHNDLQRRASAPVALQAYGLPSYSAPPHPHSYFVADEKYTPSSHQGY